MRTSRVVMSLAGWLLIVLCLTGCHRPQEPTDPIPPFTKVDEFVGGWRFCNDYDTDPSQADKKYKGKILGVSGVGDLPWSKAVRQDKKGRKYFSIIRSLSGKTKEEQELD